MSQWYCHFDGAESGPYSIEELQFLRGRGKLPDDVQVRRSSESRWQSAQAVLGLSATVPHRERNPQPTREMSFADNDPGDLSVAEREPPEVPASDRRPPSRPDRAAPARRRRWLLGVLAGAGLCCLILFLLVLFLRDGTDGVGNMAGPVGGGTDTGSHETGENQPSTETADAAESAPGPQPEPDPVPLDDAVATTADAEPVEPSEGSPDTTPTPVESPPRENTFSLPAFDDLSAAASPSGGGQASRFFGVEARGKSFVYIVDQSGSMANRRFDRAREELLDAIKRLNGRQKFFVYFFAEGTTPMRHSKAPHPKLIKATRSNVREFETWVNAESIKSGTTAQTETIAAALELKPDAIFFLSDGGFDASTAQRVREINQRPRVPINTIGFEDRTSEALLKQMAHDSGGDYRYVP